MGAIRSIRDTDGRAPQVKCRGIHDCHDRQVERLAELNALDAQMQHLLGAAPAAAGAPHISTYLHPARARRYASKDEK